MRASTPTDVRIVDAVLERQCRLCLWQSRCRPEAFQAQDVAAGLVEAGPIPGLARGHVVLADIDDFVAAADLPLRTVKEDLNLVLAIE